MSETAASVTAEVGPPPTPADSPPQTWFAHQAAFGMPEGTVRAVIALLVIGADIFMTCFYKWAPSTLDTWATVAFTFYFVQAANLQLARAQQPAQMTARVAMPLLLLMLLATPANAAAHFDTDVVTLSRTPAIVGRASGRSRFTLKNVGSPGIVCGSPADPIASYYPLAANETIAVGITQAGYFSESTADTVLMCASANATPGSVAIWEEGKMPLNTETPTPTFTNTPTITNTPAPTNTPTATPTPSATPTAT